jgi:hypothetical protein
MLVSMAMLHMQVSPTPAQGTKKIFKEKLAYVEIMLYICTVQNDNCGNNFLLV